MSDVLICFLVKVYIQDKFSVPSNNSKISIIFQSSAVQFNDLHFAIYFFHEVLSV